MSRAAGLRARWKFHRRPVLVVAAMLAGLTVVAGTAALLIHTTASHTHSSGHRASTNLSIPSALADAPTSAAPDASYWDALPAVTPAVCSAYPAIAVEATSDPTAYAEAFVGELFTRDYRHSTRDQLIAWAQWEDSPLRSPNYPPADWSKVLVDSLTDLTWDDALETPIPAAGTWLALAAQHGWQTIADLKATPDPAWEQYLADGNQPPDPLATARDMTATVTVHTVVSGKPVTTQYAIALVVQLGSSPRHGGYAAAVTNDYVSRQEG